MNKTFEEFVETHPWLLLEVAGVMTVVMAALWIISD